MKLNSMIGAVLVTAIALSAVPAIAWGRLNSHDYSNQNVTDTVMPNHYGGNHGGTHRGRLNRHGGC
ncbi:MAG: hypothetical protein SAL07_24365 [Oscillatoria sp. PMC 1051.18]|uniref:hypothetical protein n=1 Tax=Oscillatoria salina TaxID=331517 RepID=UPI0013BA94B2|nr:hypothetical protein [Oscillatoria salina]MBZ8179440.1 hypothetical protein [Oscillatoria salina IIICB1]MEC4896133.1 hypothetical protein [Oscillatoria sp. PMC 1050.18]MEC5033044.1 hypothetical protein [Oscillatoria sp. PMC 1051.18]NET90877.1 hypothetical protein [Kamptonema sp. SIO1D9]